MIVFINFFEFRKSANKFKLLKFYKDAKILLLIFPIIFYRGIH